MKNLYAVILAGGVGSRFWPYSRVTAPKQILNVVGDESLLKSTISRLSPLVKPSDVVIVTSSAQSEVIKTHLIKSSKEAGYIVEPVGRNTAPAIGIAAVELLKKDPDAIMAVLPSDHLIDNGKKFRESLKSSTLLAREGHLVTFGIKPTNPETGYGYIKSSKKLFKKVGTVRSYKVDRFVEKPDLKKAESYLKQGGYLWNSGMFVWKASSILEEFKKHLPQIYKHLMTYLKDGDLDKAYKNIKPISIDYGILEKAKGVVVIEATFPWSDMGSWTSLEDVYKKDKNGNIISGRTVDLGSKNTFILGSDRVIGTIGLENMIVIDTPDATLVCPRDKAQDVRHIVDELKKRKYSEHEIHKTVERPWGSYTVLEEGIGYKVKKILVNPGERLSLQSHRKRSEHWVVISGTARVTVGTDCFDVKKNNSVDIPMKTKHRLANPSKSKVMEIIEVQNGTYLGEDDIKRFDDDYKRS